MNDGGLDWEWTRAEFRKALANCARVTDDTEPSEGLDVLAELHTCCLLMLNFRHRLSPAQQKDLSRLAAVCDVPSPDNELRGDPEWDEPFLRSYVADAFKNGITRARVFLPRLESI